MLDDDTLDRLPDLTAGTLYSAEIARLPRRSRVEEQALVARARQGNSEARRALIESCLPYALGVASFFYETRQLPHDDLLDLVQVASERMVKGLDRALAMNAPNTYLRGIARRAIWEYCIYDAGLIQRPHYSNAELDKLDPKPAIVESLDAPLSRDGLPIKVKLVEAPAAQPERDEQSQQERHAKLYQAIGTLTKKQQEAIVRLYGLFGHSVETKGEVGPLYESRRGALKKLQTLLADSLNEPERATERHDDNEREPIAPLQEEGEFGRQASGDLPSASLAGQPDPVHGPTSDLIEPHWLQQNDTNEPTTELPVGRSLLDAFNQRPDHEQWER